MRPLRPLRIPYQYTNRYEGGLKALGCVAAAVRRLEPGAFGDELTGHGHSELLADAMDHGRGSLHVQRLCAEILERKSVALQFIFLFQEE